MDSKLDCTSVSTGETVEKYGSDFVHELTFGAVARWSIPGRLCPDDERSSLYVGSGKYSALRLEKQTVTNGDMYRYLRMGVSSQSAMALKVMGYPHPDSLMESEEIRGMLPDVLVSADNEYPVRFIEECERSGISALDCQVAVRRGITDQHLEGNLSLQQLIIAFKNYVAKGKPWRQTNQEAPTAINYICNGTIPPEVYESKEFSVESLNRVSRVLHSTKFPEVVRMLQDDPALFHKAVSKFVHAPYNTPRKWESMEKIFKAVSHHGIGALELSHPYVCLLPVYRHGKEDHEIGLDVAHYVEEVVSLARGNHRFGPAVSIDDQGVRITDIMVGLRQFEEMHRSDVSADEVRELVFGRGIDPMAVIAGRQDNVQASLMDGAL